MNRTRLSLCYLAGYLLIGGLALLVFPAESLRLMMSNANYGDVMPRVAGMLLAGLGLFIVGMIVVRAEALYPATLGVRTFFLIAIAWFYAMNHDPFFLVMGAIVALGFVMTGFSYLSERGSR